MRSAVVEGAGQAAAGEAVRDDAHVLLMLLLLAEVEGRWVSARVVIHPRMKQVVEAVSCVEILEDIGVSDA